MAHTHTLTAAAAPFCLIVTENASTIFFVDVCVFVCSRFVSSDFMGIDWSGLRARERKKVFNEEKANIKEWFVRNKQFNIR